MMEQGLLHLYWGDGKGKTTAAMGLALRALGSGKRVVIVQFLKGGQSGEIPLLAQLGAKIFRGKGGQKFVFQMNEAEKAAARAVQDENLTAALAEPADLLILDEAGSAWELDMVDKDLLRRAVLERPAAQECVLTAHKAPQWMLNAADYSTEMKCRRHPYQKGTHGQHEPNQHRRESAAIHNVFFRDLHLLRHDEQQHDANDQKQNAANQVYRVLDVLLFELCAPFIQFCFGTFYQIFHLFQLLLKT